MANPLVPGVQFQYKSFQQITADIDDARIYGGIHFRFDQEAGAGLGKRIGRYVFRNNLQCMQERDSRNHKLERENDEEKEMDVRRRGLNCDATHH